MNYSTRNNIKSFNTFIVGGDLSKVIQYNKPETRPEPILNPSPTCKEFYDIGKCQEYSNSLQTELVYNLARSGIFHKSNNSVPPWHTFHSWLAFDDKNRRATVAYNPILMANPTELSTIYTTCLRLKETANKLGQAYSPITYDMGLLTKALEIYWNKSEELNGVILREGEMHLIMSFIAGVGHLYGDTGLKNMLFESGVYAAGTTEHMLTGKDYDRAVRGLLLIEETLSNQFLMNFKKWCNRSEISLPTRLATLLEKLESAYGSGEDAKVIMEDLLEVSNDIKHLITQFKKEGESSPTFKVWSDILFEVLMPLKSFIASTRNGVWKAHQAAKVNFCPLLFASNRSVYSKYEPVIILSLSDLRLPEEVRQKFEQGQFAINITPGAFKRVPMDYTLETTINKDMKGPGGVIGLTLKGKTLLRWFYTRPVTAEYARQFCSAIKAKTTSERAKDNEDEEDEDDQHEVQDQTDIKIKKLNAKDRRWNSDVDKMKTLFGESGTFHDPFDVEKQRTQLINIATSVIANDEICNSMINALETGRTCLDKFISERLSTDKTKSFYDPLPKSRVKTMKDARKKVKVRSREVSIDPVVMFLRLFAVNSYKKVPLKRMISFENSPVPISMFNDDGTMRSTQKADFMHKLEELLPNKAPTKLPLPAEAFIVDAMQVIQMLRPGSTIIPIIFKDMALRFWNYLFRTAKSLHKTPPIEVHIVFDRYFTRTSIKGEARLSRGNITTEKPLSIDGRAKIPNWDSFLKLDLNKEGLAEYYTDFITENKDIIPNGMILYISGGKRDVCLKISTSNQVSECKRLKSNQEEADGRLILHAAYAAATGSVKSVCVFSGDTDSLANLTHHRNAIFANRIWLRAGKPQKNTDNTRYIPIHELYDILTPAQRAILLSAYIITGHDSQNSFFGVGKKRVFNAIMKDADNYRGIETIGEKLECSEKEEKEAAKFIMHFYGGKNKNLSLNELRCKKVEDGLTSNNIKKLPPTEDSFLQHYKRSTYQLFISKHATTGMMELPPATDFGYYDDGCIMRPVLMNQTCAAPELLNDIICDCADQCTSACVCNTNKQPCTSACVCMADADSPCCNEATSVQQGDENEN